MKAITSVTFGIAVCLLASTTLLGCEQSTPKSNASKAATQTPLQLVSVTLGPRAEGEGVRHANAPPPMPQDLSKPIAVRIDFSGTRPSATLEGKLIQLSDGQTVATQTSALTPGDTAPVRFAFTPQDKWQPGRYLFESTLDGKLLAQRDLDLVDNPE